MGPGGGAQRDRVHRGDWRAAFARWRRRAGRPCRRSRPTARKAAVRLARMRKERTKCCQKQLLATTSKYSVPASVSVLYGHRMGVRDAVLAGIRKQHAQTTGAGARAALGV